MAHITIHLVMLAALLQQSHVSLAGKKTLSLVLCTGLLELTNFETVFGNYQKTFNYNRSEFVQ